MLFNERNQGKDTTLDPSYFANRVRGAAPQTYEELQKQINQLREQINNLTESSTQEINDLTQQVNSLENSIQRQEQSILSLNVKLNELKDKISILEETQGGVPIPLDYIDNLISYNQQEGES